MLRVLLKLISGAAPAHPEEPSGALERVLRRTQVVTLGHLQTLCPGIGSQCTICALEEELSVIHTFKDLFHLCGRNTKRRTGLTNKKIK